MVPEDAIHNVHGDTASKYQLEYNYLTDKLTNGKEATDLMCEFWEKLAHIEYQYAKSIAQLCHSRHGRLQKMFSKNGKPLEYFRPLQSVWGAVIEDLVAHSEAHLNVAYTLQREVKPALTRFSQEELTQQVEVANHGKKVINGLKDEQAKLLLHRKKVYKTLLTDGKPDNKGYPGIEEGKEALSDEETPETPTEISETYETKALQKLWIRTRDSHAHTYNVTIPSILEELNNISVRRVQEVCNSVGHFTTLVTSANTPFNTTASTLLSAQTSVQSIRYKMETTPPPIPDMEKPMSRGEMEDFCQTPAKKFFNNIQGMFSTSQHGIQGMFNMNKQDTGHHAPATSPTAAGDNPLKDISQKVSNLLTTLRTRTLSGNFVENTAHDDDSLTDDRLLDADSDDSKILDTEGVTQNRERGDSTDDMPVNLTNIRDTVTETTLPDVTAPAAPKPASDKAAVGTPSPIESEGVLVSGSESPPTKLQEKDMVLAISPDSEDYVVVDENKT